MKLQTMRVNVCAGLALLTAGAVFGQTPAAPPAFEVASVKPAPPPTPGMIKVQMGGDPGMVDYRNVSLRTVIARAYGMIGSKRKPIAFFKDLQRKGLAAHLFDRVHPPVG